MTQNTHFTNLTIESVTKEKPFSLTYPIYMIKCELEYLSQFVIMNQYDDDDGLGLCNAAFLTLEGVPVIIEQHDHPNIPKNNFTISVDNTKAVILKKDEFNIADQLLEALDLDKNTCIIWTNEELRALRT